VKYSFGRIMEILYGPKNDVHAFGYNSAESEAIWIKSEALWARSWGLALADFGHDPHSSNSFERQPKFSFCFGQVNNARFHRFPIGQILRQLNTTTSIGGSVKTFGTEFWKFYRKGLFFQKNAKIAHKISRSSNSGRHNSAMITDCRKFTTKLTLYEMSSFHFYC